ncbi:hypothetical protein [Xylophilus sp. ASV27]|uniref:hypothetical protein n=1 Tax=Xylophilus sp. ASV27 TaxID=2795129 RepID=UPI0018EA36E3|nr:hypothetical protein [Xylophilus sp. ASV27]
MFALITRLLSSVRAAAALPDAARGIPNALFESAEACAGQNPHQAQELRAAAQAYLSVVR